MMGGYEYTPEEINKRDTEKLVDKHNESSLVIPKIFLDAGYSVTITDPPYCNYKLFGDFTPFKLYPDMQVLNLNGKYSTNYKNEFKELLQWDDKSEL